MLIILESYKLISLCFSCRLYYDCGESIPHYLVIIIDIHHITIYLRENQKLRYLEH